MSEIFPSRQESPYSQGNDAMWRQELGASSSSWSDRHWGNLPYDTTLPEGFEEVTEITEIDDTAPDLQPDSSNPTDNKQTDTLRARMNEEEVAQARELVAGMFNRRANKMEEPEMLQNSEIKSEIASDFAAEMESLGFHTKVLEGQANPLPDIVHSLTLVDHDHLSDEPTIRLYRGVEPNNGAEIAHQIGYLLRGVISEDEYGRGKDVKVANDEVIRAIDGFAANPTYRSIMDAIGRSSFDKNVHDLIHGRRLSQLRRTLVADPDMTLLDGLAWQHTRASMGRGATQDLSPFIATATTPEFARVAGKTLMVLDVPLSQVVGEGEHEYEGDEVLLCGSIRPEWITAVAELQDGKPALKPLIDMVGSQDTAVSELPQNTAMHQKSAQNRQEDLRDVNHDLIEEILSASNIDVGALRAMYRDQGIATYKDALWATANYYLKKIEATGQWEVPDVHELYKYDDVTDAEISERIEESEPEAIKLTIEVIEYLAGLYNDSLKNIAESPNSTQK